MFYKKAEGFTVLELVIVVVIIGILAAIALPSYFGMKEREHDKDASASLKLIMAAQRIYRMETGVYDVEDSGNPVTDITGINDILRLSLPSGGTRSWNYRAVADNVGPPPSTCVEASRTTTGRTIRFRNTEDIPAGGYEKIPQSETCP